MLKYNLLNKLNLIINTSIKINNLFTKIKINNLSIININKNKN